MISTFLFYKEIVRCNQASAMLNKGKFLKTTLLHFLVLCAHSICASCDHCNNQSIS